MIYTVDSVLAEIEENVRREANLAPTKWVQDAMSLTALMGDASKELYELQQKLSQKQVEIIESGKSVAFSEVVLKTTDIWLKMKIQEAKINKIEELVRLAKVRARIDSSEMHIGA